MDPISQTNKLPTNIVVALVALVALAVLVLGALFLYFRSTTSVIETRDEAIDAVSGPAIDVPSSETVGEQAPELNPLDRANPFKDAYKNPFE